MSIQPPPLLCQSWTGVISSGFSPLSFPVLLHTAFKQILLEDSNLEQCNIVQRVHTLQRLTNENAKLGSILSLSGNIPTIFLIHLGHSCYILSTFDVHSTYFNCILFQFLDARSVFGSHSGSILTSFVQHRGTLQLDFRRYSGSNRTALIWYSKCILDFMTAFWIFLLCSNYIWAAFES